ncbi:MAG: alpha/beta hydrolase [Lachnospiraceae bacterium]|nr:alpha/beta hydrolase [Lachnospiraceae bacterium]
MAERPTPPWADQIPEGSFISVAPTYKLGEYFSRFHKSEFTASDGTNMKYYWFDPTEYGYEKGGDYPVLIFLHGKSNALEGDICINYTGAEMYASDSYQKTIGGAYILIPLANEYRDAEGKVQGTWDKEYIEPLYELMEAVIADRMNGRGIRFLFGNSAGARITFRFAEAHPEACNVLIPVGTMSISTDEDLDRMEQHGVRIFYAEGKRDEFGNFEKDVVPRLPKLASMKGNFLFNPEWVRNGDGGIASIIGGIEMGQHCLMNGVQANLMLDDGTPMDERLPHGLTGWIADTLREMREENNE